MEQETQLVVSDERAEIIEQLQSDPRREQMGFVEWFLAVSSDLDNAEAKIKEQAVRMLAYIDARRKALHWKCGQDFRAQVERDIAAQGGKKRSKDYLTGRAGFRTTPAKLVVLDKTALMNWAAINCPEAVPLRPELHLTPLKKLVEETGTIPPGSDWRPKQDRFYPSVAGPELEAGDE